MSAAAAVIGRLEAVAAVTALVSTRIYQGVLPASFPTPAIRVQRISEDEFMHTRGSNGVFRTRVQVDSVSSAANPIAQAQAVDAAVRGNGAGTSLVGWTGTVGGVEVLAILPITVREGYDADELKQYKIMRDVFAWWVQ